MSYTRSYYDDTKNFHTGYNKFKKENNKEIKRGDIVIVKLEEKSIGSEQSCTRPAVVIQNNKGNNNSPTTIVAFISSSQHKIEKRFILHQHLHKEDYPELKGDSIIMTEQLRTISKERIFRKCFSLHEEDLKLLNKLLRISILEN